MATAAFRRAYLGRVYRDSQSSGRTLLEELEHNNDTLVDAISTGQVISSVSSNGHDVSFSTAANAGVSQVGMVDDVGKLIELHDACKARLIAEAIAAPTDAQIYAEMLGWLKQAARDYSVDFTLLRRNVFTSTV